jgi:NADPH:quinone reductase-like Zn-dependent oxidoreductase
MYRRRMRVAVCEHYGSVDAVEVRDVQRPTPLDDEVLVRIHATSVNRADLDQIQGRPTFVRLFIGIRRPRNPRLGLDAAGVVEAVGPGVSRFRPGDRVFADLYEHQGRAFADFACAPERAWAVIPEGLSFEDAATLPHSGILAVQGLRRRDGRPIGPGDRVLVDGASGNVGPFAVQVAKALGAHVTGVASASKLDLVRSLGADEVIDYGTVDYTSTGERYDWILDMESHHPIVRIRRALRPGGVYVTLGGTSGPLVAALAVGPVITAATGKSMGLMLWWKPFGAEDRDRLTAMVVSGSVRPIVDRAYPLDDVREALRHLDEGRARGKILVIP